MPKGYTELIHCDNCGEDFSAAYRRCPFCNAKPGQRVGRDDTVDFDEPTGPVDYEPVYDEPPAFRNSGGGKRLQRGGSGGGGGGYRRRGGAPWGKIILYVGTALVILAAVWIITTKLLPKFFSTPAPSPSPSVEASVSPSPTPVPPTPTVEPTDPALPTGDVTPTVPVAVTEPPAPSTSSTPVTALSLSSIDFTLSPKWPTYQMQVTGATGKVTYSIGSPSVATVSDSGLVTAVANGWTVLTVTDEAGASAKCDVRVAGMPKADPPAVTDNGGNSGSSGNTNTSGAKLSTTDFTLSQKLGYTAQLTVSGGTAASWSSSNESVATVSGSGLVTGVSKGTATITCTLSDGTTLTSIARVH